MDTLGLVESGSIAAGVELADFMLKAAEVELVRASTICSGRYMIYISGERDAVERSVNVALESGRTLAGSFVLSNISPQVIAVLKKGEEPDPGDAIGVIECRTVSSGIAAADSAVKRAVVRLVRLVAGQGINGKSYFVISGDVASVTEAVEAAKEVLEQKVIETVVLPRPEIAVVRAVTGAGR